MSPFLWILLFSQAVFAREKTVRDSDINQLQSSKKSKSFKKEKFIKDPFEVTMSCVGNQDRCDKMVSEIKRIGRELSSIVFFRRPIKFNVSTAGDRPSIASTRIHTVEGQFIGSDHFLSFPQSLARQLQNGNMSSLRNEFDFEIVFNDMIFWFDDEFIDEPERFQGFGFTKVFLHELAHGLGILSHWMAFDVNRIIFPRINLDPIKILPMNVYDTLLNSKDSRMVDFARKYYEFEQNPNGDVTSTEFIEELEKIAEKPFKLATTPQALHLKTKYGNVQVFSPEIFMPFSSLAHFDLEEYSGTQDELMIPSLDMMTGYGPKSVKELLGERLLWVLSEIGWPTILDKKRKNIEIVDCDDKDQVKILTRDGNGTDSLGFSLEYFCSNQVLLKFPTEVPEEIPIPKRKPDPSSSVSLNIPFYFLLVVLFALY